MSEEILKVNNLTKKFYQPLNLKDALTFNFRPKEPIIALDNISFTHGQRKILGILGPNGAGKTTLLKLLVSLLLPNQGSISVFGKTVGKDDTAIKSLLGLASSEERCFYWRLSGRENIEFFCRLYGLSREKADLRIKELFSLFNIDYADKRFDSYSTGMRRAFSLIRALLHEPGLLLLDEPTKSLDHTAASKLRDFIKNQSKNNRSVIIATHDILEAQEVCNDFLILQKGRIKIKGSLEDLKKYANTDSDCLSEIYSKIINDD
ncbi:MAG: ABC transporter ATP-binding protein [Candidatus Omnitrophica bacterium]|nr:ABC transporter ATP-binding protein [Candidatus Omnitrophota bacterium]